MMASSHPKRSKGSVGKQEMVVTRNWLKAQGASNYLAKRLTQALAVIARQGRSYAYGPEQVLASIQAYGQNARIRPQTQQILERLAAALTALIPSQSPAKPDPLEAAMAKVGEANARFETAAANARKISSDFEAYRQERGTDFKARNNAVAFSS